MIKFVAPDVACPDQAPRPSVTQRNFQQCGMIKGGGAWRRIRTTDTRIFNPLLYQLSYPGLGQKAVQTTSAPTLRRGAASIGEAKNEVQPLLKRSRTIPD